MIFQISEQEIIDNLKYLPQIQAVNSFKFVNNKIDFDIQLNRPESNGVKSSLLKLVKKVGLLNVRGAIDIQCAPQTDIITIKINVKNFVQSNIITLLGLSNIKIDILEFQGGDKIKVTLNKLKQLRDNNIEISLNSITQKDSQLAVNFNILM